MTTQHSNEDVIDLLFEQHRQIRQLFATLETANGAQRKDTFRELVRLLAVHETAEEMVVHPAARTAEGAESIVHARLTEERKAKELLSTLDKMGPDAEGFDTLLDQLREDVLAHADHEEREEFPRLRTSVGADQLRAMAVLVRGAEAIAPTRPHPGVESAAANLLAGPPAAIMDRTRDLIRKAMNR
jgi:hemerythrin superfamily protein